MILYFIMVHAPRLPREKKSSNRLLWQLCISGILVVWLSACERPAPMPTPIAPTVTDSNPTQVMLPTSTNQISTPLTSPTPSPGPSPTSTVLPVLLPIAWTAQPIMVEAAHIDADTLAPFRYTPLFLLYGDGLVITRNCQEDDCRYLQAQLDLIEICRLVNAIQRTGFLRADPFAFSVPGGTGAVIRLAVTLHEENSVQIPDLDRWVVDPSWYGTYSGCAGCFPLPVINPAFIDLYRLLTAYTDVELTGVVTERLALWLTKPVISGESQPWSPDLITLAELADRSACPEDPNRQSAVILEGGSARNLVSYLAESKGSLPLFTENGITWQVHSRWLLPYEMPQTCTLDAGLIPPARSDETTWACSPEFGAIPTYTPTITPTASITPTPLR